MTDAVIADPCPRCGGEVTAFERDTDSAAVGAYVSYAPEKTAFTLHPCGHTFDSADMDGWAIRTGRLAGRR